MLRRFVCPTVNYALDTANGSSHYGRGTRCGLGRYKPDWSLVSNQHFASNGGYANLVPGDTKLDSKWRPDMAEEDPDS